MVFNLKTFGEGQNVNAVNVHMDDTITNRMLQVEKSRLYCSCNVNGMCAHTRAAEQAFRTWKNVEMRTLRGKALGSFKNGHTGVTPEEALFAALKAKYGEIERIIIDPSGMVYIEVSDTLAAKYSQGCGWGTSGTKAIQVDGSDAAQLYVVATASNSLVDVVTEDCPLMIEMIPEVQLALTGRKVSVDHKSAGKNTGGFSALQYGLLDLGSEQDPNETETEAVSNSQNNEWAAWRTAVAGLMLEGDWMWGSVNLNYFPGSIVNGERIGALAFDLIRHAVRPIPFSALSGYWLPEEAPEYLSKDAALTHLAWGAEYFSTSGAQVIVSHPNGYPLDKIDNLSMFTTNLWQFDPTGHPDAGILNMICQVATFMVRLGHNPECQLFLGDYVAKMGDCQVNGEDGAGPFAIDLSDAEWDKLQSAVSETLAGRSVLDNHNWGVLSPPKGVYDGVYRQ